VLPPDVTSLVLNVVVVRRVAGQLRKSVKRPEWLGLSFPTVITRREVALRYGFPPEHPAREDR
jgi:hypothetical protein